MGPFPSSPAVVALGSRHRGVVGGFHFRTLVRVRTFSVATEDAVLRLGRAGAAVGVSDGRAPLVGPFPSSPAVVALDSRHKAAQPRSSEKNAASRAGQTPCARWAVGILLY